jgi:signal transduction histidine kinase
MAERRGIRERLGRLFALQLAVIGVATVVGIFLTQQIVEDLLTRQALEAEAEHFWALYDDAPEMALPNTANMRGYLAQRDAPFAAPQPLAELEDGYHQAHVAGRQVLVHVSRRHDVRLMLAFEGDQVSDLAFYFGVLPLSVVLLLIYGLLFVALRWSQRAMSPMVQLAERLESADLNKAGRLELALDDIAMNSDSEVHAMVEALRHFIDRLDRAVERERYFTRDAGHELRTPVAVLKGTLDLLERRSDRSAQDMRGLARMRRTLDGMEALLESLLLLAREETAELPVENCDVHTILRRQVADLESLASDTGNTVHVVEHAPLTVRCAPKLVDVVTLNLLRNALMYTDNGTIDVAIYADRLEIEDSGAGMSPEQLSRAVEPFYRADDSRGRRAGHGLGLSIVQRIVALLGWQLLLESAPGRGTRATVIMTAAADNPAQATSR